MSYLVRLADDDRTIRETLERALELEGYAVTSVIDGVRALSVARRDAPDVVVLDVMMPGVDGLGVCRVVRADGIRTPILMLTARVELTARVAGLDAGADDYLAKPFELDELLASSVCCCAEPGRIRPTRTTRRCRPTGYASIPAAGARGGRTANSS